MPDLIISYRPRGSKTSKFVEVNDFLAKEKTKEIENVYNGIFQSVTAYEPKHYKSFKKVESLFYDKINSALKKKIKKDKEPKKIVSIFLLGIPKLIHLFRKRITRNKIKILNQKHEKFTRSLGQMKKRAVEKKLVEKPSELIAIEKKRLEDPVQELQRLLDIPRIKSSLDLVARSLAGLNTEQKIAFAHTLELQQALKDTHYVINHGQNIPLMILNIISNELKRIYEPEVYESFVHLRHDTFLSHIQDDIQNVAWFEEQLRRTRDNYFSRELICGDCFLESTATYESALSFFADKKNIASDSYFLPNVILPIIQDYITDQKLAKRICDNILSLRKKFSRGGNLYSICIPKDQFSESCYFSSAYGFPVAKDTYSTEDLEKTQSGISEKGAPQIRVLAHKLKPENGFHIVLNSTLPMSEIEELEKQVQDCIQRGLLGYRI